MNGTLPVTPFTVFLNLGVQLTTPGTGLTQAPVTGGALSLSLDQINATYANTFSAFSPLRVLTPIGSNITDVTFSVAGSGGTTPAAVSGFGVVFSDVDLNDTTLIAFFDVGGTSLGAFSVPAGTEDDQSFSFLGVLFSEGSIISRVRITTGNTALGPTDGLGADLVVMDDFLFSVPQQFVQVPEPATLALLGIGLAGLAFSRRKRNV